MLPTPPSSSPIVEGDERVFHETTNWTLSTPTRASRLANVHFSASTDFLDDEEDEEELIAPKKKRRLYAAVDVAQNSPPRRSPRHASRAGLAPLGLATPFDEQTRAHASHPDHGLLVQPFQLRPQASISNRTSNDDPFRSLPSYPPTLPPASILSSTTRRAMIMRNVPGQPGSLRILPGQNFHSSSPLLQSFVSCNQRDAYKFHVDSSVHDDLFAPTTYCVPFSAMYSNGAKAGKNHLMAVATQEGTLEILDAKPRALFDYAPQRKTENVHSNAVFDVRWSADDKRLATAGGDHTSVVMDVETGAKLAIFDAHKLSVKTTLWNPANPDLLLSASRDGDIHAWDLRDAQNTGSGKQRPVYSIFGAHADWQLTGVHKGKMPQRSVTEVHFLPQRENLIVSSGSGDGALRTWDVRYTTATGRRRKAGTTGKAKPWGALEESRDLTALSMVADASLWGLTKAAPSRSRGISSVAVHPTGNVIWALGRNGSIFTYDLDSTGTFTSGSSKKDALLPLADPSLSSDSPFRHRSSAPRPTRNHHLASYIRQPLSHPALTVETFYPRLALSRDGEYLASGSSSGKVLLWDTRPLLSSRGADANIPTVLGGHSLETSSVDWGYDSLLSASDDSSVRVWRKDPEQARECRDEERADGAQCGAWGYVLVNP